MNLDWTTGSLSAGLNAGLNAGLTQGYSSGSSQSANAANASGQSNTDAQAAREWSAKQAEIAFNRQKELMQMEMDYNSKEAQINRDWQQANINTANEMANTVYTRSVNNMKEAGINPILAANMGLGAAGSGQITSGQGASIGGASAPMAQGFMDTSSAWSSSSQGQSSGWNKSENGIVTALSALGEMFSNALGAVNSGLNLTLNMNGLQNIAEKAEKAVEGMYTDEEKKNGTWKSTGNIMLDTVKNLFNKFPNGIGEQQYLPYNKK